MIRFNRSTKEEEEKQFTCSFFCVVDRIESMLLNSEEVLDIYVEPFIRKGFRLPNQPYSYYIRSLFSFHNETLSIWIHLIGIFLLLLNNYKHFIEISSELNGNVLCIYLIYNNIGACMMLLCSVQAHLLHSRTLSDHLRSFYIDYFGINFYGFTSGIILRRFSHSNSMNEFVYSIILSILSMSSLSIACYCKTFYRRPYPFSHRILQCSGVLILYLYQTIPVFNSSIRQGMNWHLIEFISFILSGLLFVGKIPERFSPGSFDLFGQSHHSFHLTIFFMAYSQSNAVFYDMYSIDKISVEKFLFVDIFYSFLVLIFELLIVFLWYRISRPIVEERYQLEIKKKFF